MELISSQFAEVDCALAGLGDYSVADEYKKRVASLFAMSEQQRKRVHVYKPYRSYT